MAESLLGTGSTGGRKLQQAGDSVAAALLAPLAESFQSNKPSGRRLQQEVGTATAVGAPYSENLAESASIGRRLQQVGTGVACLQWPGSVFGK